MFGCGVNRPCEKKRLEIFVAILAVASCSFGATRIGIERHSGGNKNPTEVIECGSYKFRPQTITSKDDQGHTVHSDTRRALMDILGYSSDHPPTDDEDDEYDDGEDYTDDEDDTDGEEGTEKKGYWDMAKGITGNIWNGAKEAIAEGRDLLTQNTSDSSFPPMDDILKVLGPKKLYTRMTDGGKAAWTRSKWGPAAAAQYEAAVKWNLTWNEYFALNVPAVHADAFAKVNAWFPSGKTPSEITQKNPWFDFGINSLVYHMLSGMKRMWTQQYTKLYRYEFDLSSEFEKGKVFSPKGFYVTTEIEAQPSIEALPVKFVINHAKAFPVGKVTMAPEKKNVVFPPGSSFTIIDVKKNQVGAHHTIVELEANPEVWIDRQG